MYYKEISRLLGIYLFFFSLFLFIPTLVAGYYEFLDVEGHHPQPHSTLDFFLTILFTWFLAGFFYYFGRKTATSLFRREGITTVVLIWLITPFISAMPFVLSGALTNPFQAYFELASGYTTSGATVLQAKKFDPVTGKEIPYHEVVSGVREAVYTYYGNVDPVVDRDGKSVIIGIEALSKALLFWRSFTQWLGGVGVVVLFVAILPLLGVGGKVLFQSEIAGPNKEGITPQIKETAVQLWKIYLILSLCQVIALAVTNPALEALDIATITFSTISTGGLSIKNASIASYDNVNTEMVVMLFMLIGGVNFSLYYYSFKGKLYKLYDPEFLLYITLIVVLSFWVAFSIAGQSQMNMHGIWVGDYTVLESFRYGFFQIISALTSTGFATTNYDVWPYVAQVLLVIAMYLGGMSGSTSGGIKIARILMLFKIAQNKVESIFTPETVRTIKIGGKEIDSSATTMVFVYFLFVIFLSVLGTVLFVMDGIDLETSFGLVVCCINNVGMAFRMASPLNSFAFLSDPSLVVASLLMIMGRLEFFAFFAVLVPSFWTKE